MDKIALIFIFILVCQSRLFSTGHGDLSEDSLPIQSQGKTFTQIQCFYFICLGNGMEIGDYDEDFDDSKEENKNEEEMMFDSRHGDYFPDYEEYLSIQHGGL